MDRIQLEEMPLDLLQKEVVKFNIPVTENRNKLIGAILDFIER